MSPEPIPDPKDQHGDHHPMISRTTERAATALSETGGSVLEEIAGPYAVAARQRHQGLLDEREWAEQQPDMVNHPAHYGGRDNPYEAIKVIEAWGLGFHLGTVVKYLARAGKKEDLLVDLKKARWYLDREIQRVSGEDAEGA